MYNNQDLKQAVEGFKLQDKMTDSHQAFYTWLSKKRVETVSKRTELNLPENPSNLIKKSMNDLNEYEIERLIKKLEKNLNAYSKWCEKKDRIRQQMDLAEVK